MNELDVLVQEYHEFRSDVKIDYNKIIHYYETMSTSEIMDELFMMSERFIEDEEGNEIDLSDELLAGVIGEQKAKDFFRVDYINKRVIFMSELEVKDFINNDKEFKGE